MNPLSVLPSGQALTGDELAVAIGLCLAITLWLRHRRRVRRDRTLAEIWTSATDRTSPGGPWLAYITRVYQHARRGSKAYVVWHGTCHVQDTWFEGWQAAPHTYVLLTGQTGFGPHNDNPHTFYTHRGRVLAVIPGDAPAACRRHHTRTARRARRRLKPLRCQKPDPHEQPEGPAPSALGGRVTRHCPAE